MFLPTRHIKKYIIFCGILVFTIFSLKIVTSLIKNANYNNNIKIAEELNENYLDELIYNDDNNIEYYNDGNSIVELKITNKKTKIEYTNIDNESENNDMPNNEISNNNGITENEISNNEIPNNNGITENEISNNNGITENEISNNEIPNSNGITENEISNNNDSTTENKSSDNEISNNNDSTETDDDESNNEDNIIDDNNPNENNLNKPIEENNNSNGNIINKPIIGNNKPNENIINKPNIYPYQRPEQNNYFKIQYQRVIDTKYIENYKGGELEPEWEWARNVSIVYTWVDGKDANFSDIKSKYNGGRRLPNSRDRSVDELRYSLRSVKKYMPWHNGTIYIVTDNQIPKWLDTSNPRIKMIYHKDIFPEHYRPTYDSNVIELFLDKIPGITEYFLYFNDDIFLNNYVHPCFFFTSQDHYPKVYRSYIVKLTKEKTDEIIKKNSVIRMFHASKYFTREILREYFDPKFEYRYLLHTVYVIYRDLMEPFRQLFKEELKLTCADKFRSPYEAQTLYMYQTYLFYATQHEEFPKRLGGIGKASQFEGSPLPEDPTRTVKKYSCEMVPPLTSKKYIKFGSVTNIYEKNADKFNLFRNSTQILVYNLNDEYFKDEILYQLVEYMITRYPEPTEFEKKEYIDLESYIQPILNQINKVAALNRNDPLNNGGASIQEKLKNHKADVISSYLENKEALSEPQKRFSDREEKEAEFLTNQINKELDEEWQWASEISIVYKVEDNVSKLNNENAIPEMEQVKYSIRSVEKHLPWFKGTIYIVINNSDTTAESELKTWLNTNNSRIKIIYYNQLLSNYSEEFANCSHMIKLFLDKIPGISEKFVYLKPNHYFKKYTHPRFFFSVDKYPKYNYKRPFLKKEIETLKDDNRPLYNTYELIKSYFGESYFKTYRFLYDAPIPLYRDLFEPVRQLFMDDIIAITRQNSEILPLYLISNYNIYGTEQPFYPDYVTGYGKIRDAKLPILNPERTVDFFGYDIPTPEISRLTIVAELVFTDNNNTNKLSINRLFRKHLFFSLRFKNQATMKDINKRYYLALMKKFYEEKSSFEL